MKKGVFLALMALAVAALLVSVPGCQSEQEGESYPDIVEGDPSPVHETDQLTVGWIERLPPIDYVWNSPNPEVEGWPVEGETVTWRAHVRDWSPDERTNIAFQWKVDGNIVDSGTLSSPANAYAVADLPWAWTFTRRRIDFGERRDARMTPALRAGCVLPRRTRSSACFADAS